MTSREKALKEIAEIQKTSAKLESQLSSLHKNTQDGLLRLDLAHKFGAIDIGSILEEIKNIQIRTSYLLENPALLEDATPQQGRPSKLGAAHATEAAAIAYSDITEQPARITTPIDGGKASGPFLDYLGKVFQVLGIDASPEASARAHLYKNPTRENP